MTLETATFWLLLLTFAMVAPGIAIILWQNKHIIEDQHKVGVQMGVLATTFQTIQDNLDEFAAESKATLDAALSKETLDADDKAAVERLLKRSQELKDVVPNAVTVPLPDPSDTVGVNPTQDDVIDPANPVVVGDPEAPAPVTSEEPAAEPAESVASEDSGDEAK